tara:strand:+ start:334 stop:3804 length:3471 start_codon:yes stop_codon:yes gene_type:complete
MLLMYMSEYLYPTLDDPEFNSKIASKKEFHNTQYDDYQLKSVEEESERLCNMKMELSPHQIFVRNFLSIETPYKGLLLYHGLGSGKTCSAITICEEYRLHNTSFNKEQRILVMASKNVQDNFRMQLFDDRKLELINGLWNVTGCVSQSLANEVNPTFMKNIPKPQIVRHINALIDKHYQFMGYRQFGNYVSKKLELLRRQTILDTKSFRIKEKQLLKQLFSNRLIVIDEVQNIRTNKGKEDIDSLDVDEKVFQLLMSIVKRAVNLKLVLMSATPMYDSYEEILSIINLLNANDGRSLISRSDIFDVNGNFKENGKELFVQKITGYVSFVRGENPYLFPYRVYPLQFEPSKSFLNSKYPTKNLLGEDIDVDEYVENLDMYVVNVGEYQHTILEKYKEGLSRKKLKQLGYNIIEPGVQLLTMTYPTVEETNDLRFHYGKKGLSSIMTYDDTTLDKKVKNEKKNFEYKPEVLSSFGRIFSLAEIGKYSSKLYELGIQIKESNGIVMIYSRYIEGGVIPIALMLEEMGFKRYGNTVSLLKASTTVPLDALTMKPQSEVSGTFSQACYGMITGDQALSNANREEIKALTDDDNIDGKNIKVVLVTLAGSEGIDLKGIRQVHIIDPWYNIFRIEQLIGRAVRTCSHKKLPFRKRNVQIFLYTTYTNDDIEHADLNLYRRSYVKMKQIGKLSRVLKEYAIDCHLNIKQTNFTVEKLNQTVKIELSTQGKPEIDYQVGDKQYSHLCDYMSECEYTCKPNSSIPEITLETKYPFIVLNVDKIVERIKSLFYEYISFEKPQLIKLIQIHKEYPIEQIDLALDKLIHDKTEYLTNANGTVGRLVNIDKYYRFQPLELLDSNTTHFDISRPIEFKPPGKIYDLTDDEQSIEQNLSSIIHLDNKHIEVLLNKLSVSYHTLQLNIDYENIKVKAKSLTWYQQAAIVIHQLPLSNLGITLKELYILCIHHFIEELSLEQHIMLLHKLDKSKDEVELSNIILKYYETFIFEKEGQKFILLYNEQTNSCVIFIYDNGWKPYQDIIGNIIPEQAKKYYIRSGDYAKLTGFLYYHLKKQEYILKLVSSGERGTRELGFWCKDKKEATRGAYLGNILKVQDLESFYDPKQYKNVDTCILIEILLRIYQYKNVLEDSLEKQWFLDPITVNLQSKVAN